METDPGSFENSPSAFMDATERSRSIPALLKSKMPDTTLGIQMQRKTSVVTRERSHAPYKRRLLDVENASKNKVGLTARVSTLQGKQDPKRSVKRNLNLGMKVTAATKRSTRNEVATNTTFNEDIYRSLPNLPSAFDTNNRFITEKRSLRNL